MSTTKATQKTVADEPSNDHTDIDLTEIVAQTTSDVETLPDWDVYNTACQITRDTLERVTAEAI